MKKKLLVFIPAVAVVVALLVAYVTYWLPQATAQPPTALVAPEVPTKVTAPMVPETVPTAAPQATSTGLDKTSPYNQLQELHNGNKDTLLFHREGQVSLVIIYDSRQDAPFQRKQVQILVDQIPNYNGTVDFYRMDISRQDAGQLWQNLTRRPLKDFDGGPCYVLVVLSTNPNTTNRAVAIVDSLDDDRLELSHSMNATRIQSDIYKQTRILPNDYKPATPPAIPPAAGQATPQQ
jgi:hypothetical protein